MSRRLAPSLPTVAALVVCVGSTSGAFVGRRALASPPTPSSHPPGKAASLSSPRPAGERGVPAFEASPLLAESLPVEAYSPHYPEDGDASEVWGYVAWFPSGHVFHVQYIVTNIGPGDHTALLFAYFLLPDGETVAIADSRDHRRWDDLTDESGPSFRFGSHSLRIHHPDHELRVRDGELGRLELRGVTTSRMVAPGRVRLGDGDWYEITVFAPRMRMEGTLQLPGGEEVVLEDGFGIGHHSLSTVPDRDVGVAHFRFDTFDRRTQLSLVRFTGTDAAGHRPYGFLMLFEDGEIRHYTRDIRGRFFGVRPDAEEPGYPLPDGFRVGWFDSVAGPPVAGDTVGSGPRPGDRTGIRIDARLDLAVRAEILEFLDSRVLRFVLSLIMQPVLYQFRTDYRIEAGLGGDRFPDVDGTGFAALYVLDDPPQAY